MKDGQEETQMPQTLSLLMAVNPQDEKKEEDPKDEKKEENGALLSSSQETIPEDLDELELAIQEQQRRVEAAQAAYREQVAIVHHSASGFLFPQAWLSFCWWYNCGAIFLVRSFTHRGM